jgi:O-antigen/teichoic acid export membrane protein
MKNKMPILLIKNKVNQIRNSHFLKNIMAAFTGVAAAQIITFLSMPIITRLYSPQDFGLLAAFTSLIGIIAPIVTLSYSNAISMPKSNKSAMSIASLCIFCAIIIVPLIFIIVLLFGTSIATLLNLSNNKYILYLLPLLMFISAFLFVAEQLSVRYGFFKAKAKSYVISIFSANLMKIIFGFIFPNGIILIIILILTKLVNLISLIKLVPNKKDFNFTTWFDFTGIRDFAQEYKDFPLYRLPQGIINGITLGLPVVIITSFLGVSAAGQYSLAVLVLGAPVMLLGQVVGDVLYPRITRALLDKTENATRLFDKINYFLALISISGFSIVVFFGDIIFEFLFGKQWIVAGQYSQWLSIWMTGVLVTRSCISAIPALKLQRFLLGYEIAGLLLRVAVLYFGFYFFKSDITVIAAYSLCGFILTIILLFVTRFYISKYTD